MIKDTVLEANSFAQVEFEVDKDTSEGQIVGNEELAEQGILVTRTNFLKDDKYCWVCNVSKVPVTLEKNAVIAEIRTATEAASVWTEYDPDSTDKKDKPAELKKSNKKELNQSGDQEEILVEQIQEMDSRSTNSPHRTKKTLNTEDTINDDWTVDDWLRTVRLTTGYIN